MKAHPLVNHDYSILDSNLIDDWSIALKVVIWNSSPLKRSQERRYDWATVGTVASLV